MLALMVVVAHYVEPITTGSLGMKVLLTLVAGSAAIVVIVAALAFWLWLWVREYW